MGRLVMMVTLGLVTSGGALGTPQTSTADRAYRVEIEKWRRERETRLRAPDGWLAVAGLFWLDEGLNRFGSAPANAVRLPDGAAPPVAGTFDLRGGKVTVRVEPGARVAAAGKPVTEME